MSHEDDVLTYIRTWPARDDDEISRALAIRPRQTVNMVCRRLEAKGLIRRVRGDLGKIVNVPGVGPTAERRPPAPCPAARPHAEPTAPSLAVDYLLDRGFVRASAWVTSAGDLSLTTPLPSGRGVYAFGIEGRIVYVGVATMGVARRLYFYRRPGRTQTTSIRVKALLLGALATSPEIDILVAMPPDGDWNGIRVSGPVGVEAGLIESFHLPWNVRGARAWSDAAAEPAPT